MFKAIIGLGNPGPKFTRNRHNIGFRVVDALAQQYNGSWKSKDHFNESEIDFNGNRVTLIKPTTFMNSSGQVIPYLLKKGIQAEDILVVHDELEIPFGKVQLRKGGSARGHNGLKSIIEKIGPEFYRLRFGISRPDNREEVPDYVLTNFPQDEENKIESIIEQALQTIEKGPL